MIKSKLYKIEAWTVEGTREPRQFPPRRCRPEIPPAHVRVAKRHLVHAGREARRRHLLPWNFVPVEYVLHECEDRTRAVGSADPAVDGHLALTRFARSVGIEGGQPHDGV
eukprot:5967121-Prymnesium_polylepis.1